MESGAIDGWWWLPDRADSPQFGRVSAGPNGPWQLEVFGGLEADATSADDLSSDPEGLSEEPIIHGRVLRPAPRCVTLFRCFRTHRSHSFGGALNNGEPKETWAFSEVLRGHEHVDREASAVALRVRLANLIEWSGWDRPRVDRSETGVTARVDSLDLGTAHVAGAAIALTLGHSSSLSGYEATLRGEAMFEVTPDHPVPFGTAMSDFAMPLRSLLSFLTIGHVEIRSVAMKLKDHYADGLSTWFDFSARLQRPFEESKPPLPHEMLATWRDLEDMTVQGLVGNWFALHQELEKTISYLLIPHHAPYLYADDHLMTAFIAAEAYHYARFDGYVMDRDEYQGNVDTVVAAAPEELRDWARRQLTGRNRKGQKTKLEEFVTRAGATGASVLKACPHFVDLAVKSRNQAAHSSSSTSRGEIYLGISYGLRWMLRHCLLVDLGSNEDRVGELIERNKRFRGERDLIERRTKL